MPVEQTRFLSDRASGVSRQLNALWPGTHASRLLAFAGGIADSLMYPADLDGETFAREWTLHVHFDAMGSRLRPVGEFIGDIRGRRRGRRAWPAVPTSCSRRRTVVRSTGSHGASGAGSRRFGCRASPPRRRSTTCATMPPPSRSQLARIRRRPRPDSVSRRSRPR
jgi:hypothetical protein